MRRRYQSFYPSRSSGTLLKKLRYFDYVSLLFVLFFILVGVLFIFSAGYNHGQGKSINYLKQIIWAISGIGILVFVSLSDYRKFFTWAQIIYFTVLGLLVLTLVFGSVINGARSWVGFHGIGIQISEFAKISTALFLATYFENQKQQIRELKTLLIGICIAGAPMGLILIQPDFGTAVVFVPLFLVGCMIAGVPMRYIVFMTTYVLLVFILTLLPVWSTQIQGKEYHVIALMQQKSFAITSFLLLAMIITASTVGYWLDRAQMFFYYSRYFFSLIMASYATSFIGRFILKPYQMARLVVFINPYSDPLSSGWNTIQALTAIGAGGLKGSGFLHGVKSQSAFIPQQNTDFIFSVIAEEKGFLLAGTIVFLYGLLFAWLWLQTVQVRGYFGRTLMSMLTAVLAVHVIENIGMVIGMMPVTGIPLPFISYGGSFLWVCCIIIGMINSIIIHERSNVS